MIRKSLLTGAGLTIALVAWLALAEFGVLPRGLAVIPGWLLFPASTLWYKSLDTPGFYTPYSAGSRADLAVSVFLSGWFWLGVVLSFLMYSALVHWVFVVADARHAVAHRADDV
jgi:hypothetical protein